MQTTKSYWRVVAVAGVVGLLAASACTVTTSSDDGVAGSIDNGGSTSTAGTTTTTAGTTSTAGTTGSGGTSGVGDSYTCDPDDGTDLVDTPASCTPTEVNDCTTCLQQHCCMEVAACYGTNPGNQCGFGGPAKYSGNGGGEIACFQTCLQEGFADAGVDDPALREMCASQCATDKDNGATQDCPGPIGNQTNALIGCMSDNCTIECIGG